MSQSISHWSSWPLCPGLSLRWRPVLSSQLVSESVSQSIGQSLSPHLSIRWWQVLSSQLVGHSVPTFLYVGGQCCPVNWSVTQSPPFCTLAASAVQSRPSSPGIAAGAVAGAGAGAAVPPPAADGGCWSEEMYASRSVPPPSPPPLPPGRNRSRQISPGRQRHQKRVEKSPPPVGGHNQTRSVRNAFGQKCGRSEMRSVRKSPPPVGATHRLGRSEMESRKEAEVTNKRELTRTNSRTRNDSQT